VPEKLGSWGGGSGVKEHDIQATFFDWVRIKEKHDWRFSLVFAVPNGGQRHPRVAAKLKAEGVRPGIPDIIIMAPGRYAEKDYPGAVIEFKAPKGSLTDHQSGMLHLINRAGYLVSVMRTPTAAISFLESYFGLESSEQVGEQKKKNP
jgi:hypothetical protein